MYPALVLNAAFDALVQNNDSEAINAETVIAYGAKLRRQRNFELSLSFRWKKRDSFRGNTNEIGDMSVDEEKKELKEIGLLVQKERIGNYRIWKSYEGHLQFHRYWASDSTTQTDVTPEIKLFHLFYNSFRRHRFQSLFHRCITSFLTIHIVCMDIFNMNLIYE